MGDAALDAKLAHLGAKPKILPGPARATPKVLPVAKRLPKGPVSITVSNWDPKRFLCLHPEEAFYRQRVLEKIEYRKRLLEQAGDAKKQKTQ